MEVASAPPIATIVVSENDVEYGQVISTNNQTQRERNKIFNRVVYFLLICSVSFIIYENHEIIGFYLEKIRDVKVK